MLLFDQEKRGKTKINERRNIKTDNTKIYEVL